VEDDDHFVERLRVLLASDRRFESSSASGTAAKR